MEVLIEWVDEFSVENEVIDNQHKQLIAMINDLYAAFVESKAKDIIFEILVKMEDYTVYHFKTEEKLFEKYNYSDTAAHIEEHQSFVSKITEFTRRYERGDVLLTYDLMSYLQNWLANHIVGSDKKYIGKLGQ